MHLTRFTNSSRYYEHFKNADSEDLLAAHRFTSFRLHSTTRASYDIAPDVTEEEKLEEVLQMSKGDHILTCQTLYATPKDVQILMEATSKVHKKTILKRLVDDIVNKKVRYLLKSAHERGLTTRYTEQYQTANQAIARVYTLEKHTTKVTTKLER